jgi:hypothetical protein
MEKFVLRHRPRSLNHRANLIAGTRCQGHAHVLGRGLCAGSVGEGPEAFGQAGRRHRHHRTGIARWAIRVDRRLPADEHVCQLQMLEIFGALHLDAFVVGRVVGVVDLDGEIVHSVFALSRHMNGHGMGGCRQQAVGLGRRLPAVCRLQRLGHGGQVLAQLPAAHDMLGGLIGFGDGAKEVGMGGSQRAVEVFRHAARAGEVRHQCRLLGGFGEPQRQMPAFHLFGGPGGQAGCEIDLGTHAHLHVEVNPGDAAGGVVRAPAELGDPRGRQRARQAATGSSDLRFGAQAPGRIGGRAIVIAGPLAGRCIGFTGRVGLDKLAASAPGRRAGGATRPDRVGVHA